MFWRAIEEMNNNTSRSLIYTKRMEGLTTENATKKLNSSISSSSVAVRETDYVCILLQ